MDKEIIDLDSSCSDSDDGEDWDNPIAVSSPTAQGMSGAALENSLLNKKNVMTSNSQMHLSNGSNILGSSGMRILPNSFTKDKYVEGSQQNAALYSGRKANESAPSFARSGHASSYPSYSSDGVSFSHSTEKRKDAHNYIDITENKGRQRILPPSLLQQRSEAPSNTMGIKSFPHSLASVGFRPHNGTTMMDLSEKTMSSGANSFKDVGKSSSHFSGLVSAGSSSKGPAEDDVYGSYNNTHRALPKSFTIGSSANGLPIGDVDAHSRMFIEDRQNESERMIYQEALQHIGQPRMEDDLPHGVLSVKLLKHQRIALAWMVQKEKSVHCSGGILADDQGLGKTVSTIALIQKQRELQSRFTTDSIPVKKHEALNLDEDDDGIGLADKTNNMVDNELKEESVGCSYTSLPFNRRRPAGGTLVVCPATVLKQWANELSDKVTESSKLSVLVYHGGTRTRKPEDLANNDVVVTTYAIVSNEVPKQVIGSEDGEQNFEKCGISSEFSASKKRKSVSDQQKKAKRKGKKSKDLDSDITAGPLSRVRWFRVVLDEAQTIKNHRTQIARACCGLRAKSRWCLSGTPIQNAIDDLYSYFRFLKYDPYYKYSTFATSIKHPISRNANEGYKKLQAVLRTVLLRRTKETILDGEPIIRLPSKSVSLEKVDFRPEERAFYMQLEERSRQQFKVYAAAGTVRQNYASILLMLLRLRQACDHPGLVKGRQSAFIGGSFERARELPMDALMELLDKLDGSSAICGLCNDPPDDPAVTRCGHVYCYQCIYSRITSDENVCAVRGCKNVLSIDSVFGESTLRSCVAEKLDSDTGSSSVYDEDSAICQSSFVSSKINAAVNIINTYCVPDSVDDLTTNSVSQPSCSGTALEMSADQRCPVKALVFSQWTGMLDLMELSLNNYLIQYRRLDGTMTLPARDRAVKDFNSDPEIRVMLMSLKAGNLGLNMVAACRVILLDLWWNPYAEDQAVDRVHRIGQTRPVTVSRITIQNTVEDRILALQEEKRKMVTSAFGDDRHGGHGTRLTVEDLRYLFNS